MNKTLHSTFSVSCNPHSHHEIKELKKLEQMLLDADAIKQRLENELLSPRTQAVSALLKKALDNSCY